MQNAVVEVRAFASEDQPGAVAAELRAPGDQFVNALRPLLNQSLDRGGIAQTVAGLERPLQVQADFIFVAERGRRAALRGGCLEVRGFIFCQQEHAPRRR